MEQQVTDYSMVTDERLVEMKREAQKNRTVSGVGPKGAVPMTADECKKACDKLNKEYLPGYEGRVLQYVITNESKDRYGDIVRAKGVDLTNYNKNPVVLYAHEQGNLPVGTSLKTWCDKQNRQVLAQAMFLDNRVDESGRSDLVFKFARAGYLPGCSIGFLPKEVNRPVTEEDRNALGLGQHGVEYQSCELLEWSPCSVPANPDALMLQFKSIDAALTRDITREDLAAAEKAAMFDGEMLGVIETVLFGKSTTPCCRVRNTSCSNDPDVVMEDTFIELAIKDNPELATILRPYPSEHACRLNAPSKYEDFRRGTRKHEGKAYSIIWGKIKGEDKWEEQAYRYPKDKWDVTAAKDHCKEHNGKLFEPAAEPKSSSEAAQPAVIVNVDMSKVIDTVTGAILSLEETTKELMTMICAATEELRSAARESKPITPDGKSIEEERSIIESIFQEKR